MRVPRKRRPSSRLGPLPTRGRRRKDESPTQRGLFSRKVGPKACCKVVVCEVSSSTTGVVWSGVPPVRKLSHLSLISETSSLVGTRPLRSFSHPS